MIDAYVLAFNELANRLCAKCLVMYGVHFDKGTHWGTWSMTKDLTQELFPALSARIEESLKGSNFKSELSYTTGSLYAHITNQNFVFDIEFKSNGNLVILFHNDDPEFESQAAIWKYLLEGRIIKRRTLIPTDIQYYLCEGLLKRLDQEWVADEVTSFYNFADYGRAGTSCIELL